MIELYYIIMKEKQNIFVAPKNWYFLFLMAIHFHLNLCPFELFERDLRDGHKIAHET